MVLLFTILSKSVSIYLGAMDLKSTVPFAGRYLQGLATSEV